MCPSNESWVGVGSWGYAVAVPFEEPGIQVITLSLISVAAVVSLLSVTLGVFSIVTGKDPLPKRIRSLLRRLPASTEDFRLRGMSLTLNGAAVMLMVSLLTINVVDGLAVGGWSGYAPSASLAFPKDTVFLVTTVAALAAIVCFVGAYALGVRVRYVSTRLSTDPAPGMPPT
jgi:hypothetical protein